MPLARLFYKASTIGCDLNKKRVDELMSGRSTLEVEDELLQQAIANGFRCTANVKILKIVFHVVAVPTP